MNQKSKNNSVIFLTTLSVYLGLVLVGGAISPVLAQAAMTRNFNVQDETEVKDDLDKNPDSYDGIDKDIEKIQDFGIAESILNFLSDIKKLESIGKFQPQKDLVFFYEIGSEEYETTAKNFQESNVSNPWLKTALGEIISNTPPLFSWISDYTLNCNGNSCRESSIKIESTSNNFSLTFTFTKSSPEKARLASEAFNKVFVSQKVALKNSANLSIYENTKATFVDNQVFIITCLPRGSLDNLLKQDAKADNQ